MALFRREWTPQEADDWTIEDLAAVVLSVASYVLLTVGAVLILVRPMSGILWTLGGIIAAVAMYWLIDPKLRTISEEYELKQQQYLKDLDQSMHGDED